MDVMLNVISGCSLALAFVYLYHSNFGVELRSKFHKKPEHDHPFQTQWSNKTWAPNPGFNSTPTCGHIRPGEWQCNCEDQTKPCSVLVSMRAPKEPDPEITDRRGLIAAQKARKRNR